MAFQTYLITCHKTPHLPSGMAVGSKAHAVLRSVSGPGAVGSCAVGPSQTQAPAERLGAPRGRREALAAPSGGHDGQRPRVLGQDEPVSTPRRRRAAPCHNQPRRQVQGQAAGPAGTGSGAAPALQCLPRAAAGRRGQPRESPALLLTRGGSPGALRGASPPAPPPCCGDRREGSGGAGEELARGPCQAAGGAGP